VHVDSQASRCRKNCCSPAGCGIASSIIGVGPPTWAMWLPWSSAWTEWCTCEIVHTFRLNPCSFRAFRRIQSVVKTARRWYGWALCWKMAAIWDYFAWPSTGKASALKRKKENQTALEKEQAENRWSLSSLTEHREHDSSICWENRWALAPVGRAFRSNRHANVLILGCNSLVFPNRLENVEHVLSDWSASLRWWRLLSCSF